ncbi:MAG: hypothetical protein ACJAXA_001353 [Candidatus Aldehydirespiratoraceae bacterium]|jgi:hypothetical protein
MALLLGSVHPIVVAEHARDVAGVATELFGCGPAGGFGKLIFDVEPFVTNTVVKERCDCGERISVFR